MPTRNYLQHFVSTTVPTNVILGDEWYNPDAMTLYKRSFNSTGQVDWIELNRVDNLGNKSFTNPTIKNYTEQLYFATVVRNAVTLSMDNGSYQSVTTMAGANAITLPPPVAGKGLTVQVNYVNTPTTLTFATPRGTVRYNFGSTPTPTLTNGKVDVYVFISDGVNWYASQSGANF
jgi:hypothetical protein